MGLREIEGLRLMERGNSTMKIADSLDIAPATVKRSVSTILSKLGFAC
jgi:DNA-binding NarL/FixJ family response regulator